MSTNVARVNTISPIDGRDVASYAIDSPAGIDAALDRSAAAQRAWANTSLSERGEILVRVAAALRARSENMASLVTLEMGKTLREARAEIEKSAWVCEYYAENGGGHLAPEEIRTTSGRSYVQFPPLGVVLAIMPWNYPIWQVMRAAAPVLMAGNTVLLKHASNVTGSAIRLGATFDAAEAPSSLLEVIVTGHGDVERLIADDRVTAVTLTGSERAGIAVAGVCARYLKKSVLELGGSDPFIVLADADVEAAARAAATGRFLNAGQSCIAAKRFIVVDEVRSVFEEAFRDAALALTMGDPRDEASDLGPMARVDLRDELRDQLHRGLAAGGALLCGGEPPDCAGAYFPPTIVSGIGLENPLAREETFGPLAAVIAVADEAAAIEAANHTPFGLSSSLWSRDVERAAALASEIAAGAVFVNTFSASDPRMPFGGIKRSGWGRELGPFGIREFVNVQAVTVA